MSEPMMFKTKEEVEQYFAGDTITCLICGKEFKMLCRHLKFKHQNISVDDYKIMFGLPHCRGLVSDRTLKIMADNLGERKEKNPSKFVLSLQVMYKAQHAPKHKPVYYSALNKKFIANENSQNRKHKSNSRILSMDWNKYLKKMEKTGLCSDSLQHIPGMPSAWEVNKMRKLDSDFNKKYIKLFNINTHESNKYKNEVMALTKKGKTQRWIAKYLGIGKTTVVRIKRRQRDEATDGT